MTAITITAPVVIAIDTSDITTGIVIITIGVGDSMAPSDLIDQEHEDEAEHERYSDPPYRFNARLAVMMVVVVVMISWSIATGYHLALF